MFTAELYIPIEIVFVFLLLLELLESTPVTLFNPIAWRFSLQNLCWKLQPMVCFADEYIIHYFRYCHALCVLRAMLYANNDIINKFRCR